jgi:hypothetical protein
MHQQSTLISSYSAEYDETRLSATLSKLKEYLNHENPQILSTAEAHLVKIEKNTSISKHASLPATELIPTQ